MCLVFWRKDTVLFTVMAFTQRFSNSLTGDYERVAEVQVNFDLTLICLFAYPFFAFSLNIIFLTYCL